jgi:hypothetical protein
MKTTTTILLAARILFAVTLWSQSNDPLELVNTIPVPALHEYVGCGLKGESTKSID